MRLRIASMLLGASAALPGARALDTVPAAERGIVLSALTLSDQRFLVAAAQRSRGDIEAAQIALQRAQSAAVRGHAQQMLQAHRQVDARLRELAARFHVQLPDEPDRAQQPQLSRLRAVEAQQFDAEFLRYRREQQARGLALFEGPRKQSAEPAVQAFAAHALELLRQLQQAAELPAS